MKLYKIREWAALFENNRSRTVKDLAWVPIPNRHDGENYSLIMAHPKAAEIFAAWVLLLQVASRCQPRGSLVRDNKKPHTPETLAMKTRAPEKWFVVALEFLENQTDWLEIDINYQQDDTRLTPSRQSPDEEGNGREWKEQNEIVALRARFVKPSLEEVKLCMNKSGCPQDQAQHFINYYEANGWKVGRNQMKSWPHAVANWSNNNRTQKYGNNSKPVFLKTTPPPAIKGQPADPALLKKAAEDLRKLRDEIK